MKATTNYLDNLAKIHHRRVNSAASSLPPTPLEWNYKTESKAVQRK
jgi:hypothetical protein